MNAPTLLDLFCGVGGWSKAFAARGWRCVGVDIANLGYPYELIQADVPALMPKLPMGKEKKSGMRPELRAEIPAELADWIAGLWSNPAFTCCLTEAACRASDHSRV